MKAILIGILGALFFSVTFVLNRSMELDGGSWVWSASLRFMFMLPLLFIIVGYKRNVKPVYPAYEKTTTTMVSMGYGWLRFILRTTYICICLRSGLANRSNLSNYDYSWFITRTVFK